MPNQLDTSRTRAFWRRGAAAAAALVVTAGFSARGAQAQSCGGMVANTSVGQICGTTETATVNGKSLTMNVFKGIPYARAPVGALRWQPPADTSWNGTTLNATEFGSKCVQGPPSAPVGSEACLYLNVWMPPGASASSSLPVMVFIHGGAFVEGAGSAGLYDGGYIPAMGNVVLVTLNYRLGPFGFLYTTSVDSMTVQGNQGIRDQQAALRWVRNNIAAFGGDTSRVTLFGESAGAMSTGLHLFSVPTSVQYFRAAIMESNPMGVVYRNVSQANTDGGSFIGKLCDVTKAHWYNRCPRTASWLQNATAQEVMLADSSFEGPAAAVARLLRGGLAEGLPWTPVVDGVFVVGQPYAGYASGTRVKPLIFGINHDEGMVFAAAAQAKAGLTDTRYNLLLDAAFGLRNANTISTYKTSSTSNPTPYAAKNHPALSFLNGPASALEQLLNDLIFGCGNLAAANQAVSVAKADSVWGYRFQQPPFFNLYDSVAVCSVAAGNVCHANELPYLFHTFAYAASLGDSSVTPTRADSAAADSMTLAWTRFAYNPSSRPSSAWAHYTTNGSLYTLGGPSGAYAMQSGLSSSANCTQLWNTLPPLNGTAAPIPTPSSTSSAAPPPGLIGRSSRR